MNVITFFIPYTQTPLIKQPIKSGLDHVAELPQAATVFRISLGDQRFGLTLTQRFTNFFLGVIGAIRQHFIRTLARSSTRLLDGWNVINQGNSHFRIMHIGTGMLNRQRCPLAINNQMTLRAIFAPIRGIRACFRPPKSARTEQLSMAETDQSIASAMPSSSNRICHISCQTPAACQSRKRRQHVMPLPQPISLGRYSQGVPVLRTNRIPVKQARSGTRGRPPLGLGGSGGIWGLIRCHSSSVSSGLAIIMSSITSGYSSLTRCCFGQIATQSLGFVRVPKYHRLRASGPSTQSRI
jgi:hypothetical protein